VRPGVTVCAGLQLGDGERRKTTWRARGARHSGLERKVWVCGQEESLPHHFHDPVSPLLTTVGTEDWRSGRKTMASRDPFVSEREVKGAMLSDA
jgi:hypothetical protein